MLSASWEAMSSHISLRSGPPGQAGLTTSFTMPSSESSPTQSVAAPSSRAASEEGLSSYTAQTVDDTVDGTRSVVHLGQAPAALESTVKK